MYIYAKRIVKLVTVHLNQFCAILVGYVMYVQSPQAKHSSDLVAHMRL